MTKVDESKSAKTGTGLKRDVGPIGLLFAAIGSIIGSGWLFGAFNASAIAGPSAIFSWLIAGVMIMLIGPTSRRSSSAPAGGWRRDWSASP